MNNQRRRGEREELQPGNEQQQPQNEQPQQNQGYQPAGGEE